MNYNNNVVYFEANENNDYEVLTTSLEKNIDESAFYHKGYAQDKNFVNILKIYLQPKGTSDIVVIEYLIYH